MLRVYVAGPMTGVPQFNYPRFDTAAAQLREMGYTVVTPSELDAPHTRAIALQCETGTTAEFRFMLEQAGLPIETWGDFLSRDVKIVADDVDCIALLPGWQKSRGARLEAFVGILCKHTFFEYNPDNGWSSPAPAHYILAEIARHTDMEARDA